MEVFEQSYMYYVRSFLYAAEKNISEAVLDIQLCYKNREIPHVLIERLNKTAEE